MPVCICIYYQGQKEQDKDFPTPWEELGKEGDSLHKGLAAHCRLTTGWRPEIQAHPRDGAAKQEPGS